MTSKPFFATHLSRNIGSGLRLGLQLNEDGVILECDSPEATFPIPLSAQMTFRFSEDVHDQSLAILHGHLPRRRCQSPKQSAVTHLAHDVSRSVRPSNDPSVLASVAPTLEPRPEHLDLPLLQCLRLGAVSGNGEDRQTATS